MLSVSQMRTIKKLVTIIISKNVEKYNYNVTLFVKPMYLKLYYLEHYSIFWNFLKVEENYKTNFFFPISPFFF